MIPQLVDRLIGAAGSQQAAAAQVLTSDPMDLVLHMEQVWNDANVGGFPASTFPPVPPGAPGPAGATRRLLWSMGQYFPYPPTTHPAWFHTGYSYVLENTRVIQILARVVKEFRSGEALGIPQLATNRWLDATEALLFDGANLFGAWLSTSSVRPRSAAVRRNLYWRLMGAELAFGNDDNTPFVFDRAAAANTGFIPLFEELLAELWRAMSNLRNTSGENQADDDRIYRIAEQLSYMMRVRRQQTMLAREELAAATVLGWAELTLDTNTPIVMDLRADASSPGDRLRLIGERVGLPAHSRSSSFFSMAQSLSMLLRAIEGSWAQGPSTAWLLYANTQPNANVQAAPAGTRGLGDESRRVITEWSAATGKDLKTSSRPRRVEVARPPAPAGR